MADSERLPAERPVVMTVPEAGKKLGLGRDASYAAARKGEIPVVRFGRLLRVPVSAFDRLLDQPMSPRDGQAA
jgi:excisionase family DNA binding protein